MGGNVEGRWCVKKEAGSGEIPFDRLDGAGQMSYLWRQKVGYGKETSVETREHDLSLAGGVGELRLCPGGV